MTSISSSVISGRNNQDYWNEFIACLVCCWDKSAPCFHVKRNIKHYYKLVSALFAFAKTGVPPAPKPPPCLKPVDDEFTVHV